MKAIILALSFAILASLACSQATDEAVIAQSLALARPPADEALFSLFSRQSGEVTPGDKFTLAYWNIQGRAHPSRYLLAYHNVEFEDKQYVEDDEWFGRDKLTLNTPFPNLPYIKDGDFILSESTAIIQYAALKTGNKDLIGKTELDRIIVTQWMGVLADQMTAIDKLTQNKNYWTIRDEGYYKNVAPFFDKLSKALGEKEFALGYLTYVDFYLFYHENLALRMNPVFLDQWPNLMAHHNRIFSNEGIQAYRRSPNYPKIFHSERFTTWLGEETV